MGLKFRKNKIASAKLPKDKHIFVILFLIAAIGAMLFLYYGKIQSLQSSLSSAYSEKDKNYQELTKIATDLDTLKKEYDTLKNEDQKKKNDELKKNIDEIEKTYDRAVGIYEDILALKEKGGKTTELDKLFAESLKQLSDQKYADADKTLTTLATKIKEEETKFAATFTIPANVAASNTPPGTGYSRQTVSTDSGNFMVSMVAGDLGSTKVIVDTASDSDCSNNCPVLPLSTYVSRSGAYAGVNGSYFCPASYPTCAGKTNTYDLLLMNKNKNYFNSDNNVYSNNPAVIFGGSYVRFVGAASSWGRDTGIDSMISNYPLLVSGGNIASGSASDPKMVSKGARSFVANKGNTVYIGVVHSATVPESAKALKALGMENALNLDDGGSTALWSGGYKVGPGRELPNVILFIKR